MSKVLKRAVIAMPTERENKIISAAARADPNAQPLTPKQLKAMVPLRALRGRPKSPNPKQLVSVRYSQEVLEFFADGVVTHWRECRPGGLDLSKAKWMRASAQKHKHFPADDAD